MFEASSDYTDAIAGSFHAEFSASVTRGGLVLGALPATTDCIVTWQWQGSQIQTNIEYRCDDETGDLLSGIEAPAAPFGQEMHLRYTLEVGGGWQETIPVGVFRILDPRPGERRWVRVGNAETPMMQPTTLDIEATDRLVRVSLLPLLEDTSPISGGVRANVVRLIDGLLPIGDWTADSAVPSTGVVWTDSRMEAVETVMAVDDLIPWADRSGVLQALADTVGEPVVTWTVDAYGWDPSVDGLVNAVVIDGETGDQTPVRGSKVERSGPLAWDDDGFGRVALREQNPLMRTTTAAKQAAATRLSRIISRLTVPITVTVPTDARIDPLDTARIITPERTMTGLVTGCTYDAGPTMSATVAVPWEQVWT